MLSCPHDEHNPVQTPTRAVGGKKAGDRGGGGYAGGCGGQPDDPSSTAADRTSNWPEAKGGKWGWSVELDDKGSLRRGIVISVPHWFDADRPSDAGSRR